MSAEVLDLERGGVFLNAYLAPFRPWIDRDDVTEIIYNRPGEYWVEIAGEPHMTRIETPDLTDRDIQRLAEQVARFSHQGINRASPLLAAVLPGGTRVQFVAPSATRDFWAMALRRHSLVDLPLDAYDLGPLPAQEARSAPDPVTQPIEFLRHAVRHRKTILISGGTSTGKTTFLNALLSEVPRMERVILVEDTPEIRLRSECGLGLVAVKGDSGEARIATEDLLQAALRLRPDRIVLGEIRGREAISFLRAINTGHPGSFTTVHANSPDGALEQLALMVMEAGLGLNRADTVAYASSMIDLVVQLDRIGGRRRISAIKQIGPQSAGRDRQGDPNDNRKSTSSKREKNNAHIS